MHEYGNSRDYVMRHSLKYHSKLEKARQCIQSVKGKPLSLQERTQLATELASLILLAAEHFQTNEEKQQQKNLAKMMEDPMGKIFTTAFTDQSFRPNKFSRIAHQMVYLLHYFGVPNFLSPIKTLAMRLLKTFGLAFPALIVPGAIAALRRETSKVIIPGEKKALLAHIKTRSKEGIRLNLNHLGEAILGEEEANKRLEVYLKDLKEDAINYVSIKISTIYSQINLISWNDTLEHIANKLRKLYRTAIKYPYLAQDGQRLAKFINLDMEEYKDLLLTKEVFKKVLDEEEFKHYSAGIVLQAYIPDSHLIQQELTEWAMKRCQKGGAPIKIRLVKGANLAMERVEASLRGWSQATYESKIHTDANYKRMVHYALETKHIRCATIGIGSHNLFDIAYALLLASENEVFDFINFEMLEGMADHIRRIIHELTGTVLLYCAVATKQDFQSAIAYLIRRLDENTGPENFLRHMFNLHPGTESWDTQTAFFLEGFKQIQTAPLGPNRKQNRYDPPKSFLTTTPFENEPDTDFSLPTHVQWAADILNKYKDLSFGPIPLVINGKEIHEQTPSGKGYDPSKPGRVIYTYSMAHQDLIEEALRVSKSSEALWKSVSIEERIKIIAQSAHLMRVKRADFIGVMIADGGKTIIEADTEYSEAIDFAEYYLRSMLRYNSLEDLSFSPRGTILITPPWNFPVSIPAGGIIAALITGNCVLFKPAPEAVLCGWELAKLFWQAGVPKNVLQFINCVDEPIGSELIKDCRINSVILTGATATAKLFLQLRHALHLCAETGGKNALIITAMADKDLAIKDLVHSAFGHNGQKCSAASLAILEKEVYEDEKFLKQLRDAVSSLKVGSAWNPQNKITPLIKPPGPELLKALTTLEPGESWLLKPRQDPSNPNLWSPGIKLGVTRGSFTQTTELFGPVLGLIQADDLDHAMQIANSTPYGLTSGLHSLDEREQKKWQNTIIAGNCYINRTITGALVQRQPFGGCKKSSFGNGAKAGGPNYLLQFMHATQKTLPKEKSPVNTWVNRLSTFLEKFDFSTEDLGTWYASVAHYAFWWQRFKRDYDPTKILGQDNIQRYVSHKKIAIRLYPENDPLDYLRLFAAALTTETSVQISWKQSGKNFPPHANWQALLPLFNITEESEEDFLSRVRSGDIKRVRMISKATPELLNAAAISACYINDTPVLANGRIELLHYLREVSLSIDYHRYGNLGLRENEMRKPIT
jgi:RHH-type transcriptional regulator, proline utilization regulon repressor / proline dehydrogenase / delta 1-pyrroline-5-carboxylate dehydrogenase